LDRLGSISKLGLAASWVLRQAGLAESWCRGVGALLQLVLKHLVGAKRKSSLTYIHITMFIFIIQKLIQTSGVFVFIVIMM
jgi:hypothetical protein